MNKLILIIVILIILIYRNYIYNKKVNIPCKNWDELINSNRIKDKNIYKKKNKNLGLLINCFGIGHLTQANNFYKISKKIGYNIRVIILFSNKFIDTKEYNFNKERIIKIHMDIKEKDAGNLDSYSIIKYLLFNTILNKNKVNNYGVKNKVDLWINFFAPAMNLDIKTLLISRQSSHKMSLINNYITNYLISYNLIHVSILKKNMFSDYWIPSLINNKKIIKNNIKNKICVAYYSFDGPFMKIIKKIAINNSDFKIYLFKNKKFDDLPSNIIVKNISKIEFKNYLKICSCVLCTSGNELIQECVYNYIPVATIPSNNNNWEQVENFNFYCNELQYSEKMKMNTNLESLSNKNVKRIGDEFNKSIENRDVIINYLLKKFI